MAIDRLAHGLEDMEIGIGIAIPRLDVADVFADVFGGEPRLDRFSKAKAVLL